MCRHDRTELVELFLAHGADVDCRSYGLGEQQWTALHHAAKGAGGVGTVAAARGRPAIRTAGGALGRSQPCCTRSAPRAMRDGDGVAVRIRSPRCYVAGPMRTPRR